MKMWKEMAKEMGWPNRDPALDILTDLRAFVSNGKMGNKAAASKALHSAKQKLKKLKA